MSTDSLKYGAPIQSFLDTSFFQELSRLKLDVLKLDTTGQPLFACLDTSNTPKTIKSVPLFLNGQSFNEGALRSGNGVPVKGMIYNFNVLEEFKTLDKQKFLEKKAQEKWEQGIIDINNSVGFYVISFSDLKKYRFYYWVCAPCFQRESLTIKVLEKKPVKDAEIYQLWFKENIDQWIGLINENKEVVKYSKNAALTCDAIIIRDSSRLEEIPSAMLKNFLTLCKHNNPGMTETAVYMIRPNDKSFRLRLLLTEKGSTNRLQVSGWERNAQGKLGPRAVDLSSLIDPLKVAEQSVDLNLKLMKWRIVPDIDLDVIKNTKVLLLGAGTLGCYVSRALMAWGVRKITLVDNSTVSFSNPVRQPLFQFDDVGKPKAQAAATSLKKVFPLLDVEGIKLDVPMIGHPVTNEEIDHEEYNRLCELFAKHDAIFLLMDSRETRWLPTVLGNLQNKIVINAALGFDSYLVMRHGNYYGDRTKRLGCYFCHDVFAPKDSLTDRTLDEMCTVTRPGVALMAASQAVELLVSVLQPRDNKEENKCILGDIPHQIRGFLNNFSSLQLETPAYNHCSACSPEVINMCKDLGWDFVKAALNDHTYVEQLSGLAQVHEETEKITEKWEFEDEEEEGDDFII